MIRPRKQVLDVAQSWLGNDGKRFVVLYARSVKGNG
jgi:hypothetical protein